MPLSQKYLHLRKDNVPDLHNKELLQACQKDKDLLAELLQENKDFIFSIIAKYKGNIENLKEKFNVTEEELLQHAYIGIITALKDFDFNRGVKFTTYCYRPILWEINQLLYNDSKLVRLSRSAVDLVKKMEKIENQIGHFPSVNEMSKMLGVSEERIEEIIRFADALSYIDAIENFEPKEIEAEYEDYITNKVYVQELIGEADLDEFEMKVAGLIMAGLNNSQIADILNVYPMTINRALERIRNKIENDFDSKRTSKYEDEIELIVEELKERECLMSIDDILDLFLVCGFDTSQYTPRVLYYIRQKAVKRLNLVLDDCIYEDYSEVSK